MLIPWFKMPIRLRALPFDQREQALKEYEAIHGQYDWKTGWKTVNGIEQPNKAYED